MVYIIDKMVLIVISGILLIRDLIKTPVLSNLSILINLNYANFCEFSQLDASIIYAINL